MQKADVYSSEDLEIKINEYYEKLTSGKSVDSIYEEIIADNPNNNTNIRALALACIYNSTDTNNSKFDAQIKVVMLEIIISPLVSCARAYIKNNPDSQKIFSIYSIIYLYMKSNFIVEKYRLKLNEIDILDLLDENKFKRDNSFEDEDDPDNSSMIVINFIIFVSRIVANPKIYSEEIGKNAVDFVNYVVKSFENENPSFDDTLIKFNLGATRFTTKNLTDLYNKLVYLEEMRQLSFFLKQVNLYGTLLKQGKSVVTLYNEISKGNLNKEMKSMNQDALVYAYIKQYGNNPANVPKTGEAIIDFIINSMQNNTCKQNVK